MSEEKDILEQVESDWNACCYKTGCASEITRLRGEVERLSALASREGWVMVGAIVSPFGDPEAFGEREVEIKADLMKFPYNTPLYALSSAPKPEEG